MNNDKRKKQNNKTVNDHSHNVFPKDFLWGASTATHQVEGGNVNQWSAWELENATDLAKTAKERLSWMPTFGKFEKPATDPENYISGNGIEHYTRYKSDMKLAKELNLNSFRFGIEWSRVEPREGVWDAPAWQHYKEYIAELLDLKIEPVLNIWHWTMPTWFIEKGGFEKKKNIVFFERFVKKLCEELQIHNLRYIITLNEPNVYATFGYVTGEWPPNNKNIFVFGKVYYNLVRAHKRSYSILKEANPRLRVGVAAQLANIQSKRPQNLFDLFATRWMRYAWNWWFLNRIKKQQDFVGFNYYFTDYYRFGDWQHIKKGELFYKSNPKEPINDLGWYMEPEGIYPLLVRVWSHYKKPIMITENGLADTNDVHRRWWIEQTIVAMERALSEDIQLIGYQHWSLLDNFEWATGWWPEFGLIHVDRKTMKRTVRPSAKYYAEQIDKLSK